MCAYEADDVIHYSHLHGGVTEIDAWVLATDSTTGKCILLRGSFYDNEEGPGRQCSIGESDPSQQGRQVVLPEEWPDDIAVLVAKIKLGVIGWR